MDKKPKIDAKVAEIYASLYPGRVNISDKIYKELLTVSPNLKEKLDLLK